MKFIKIIKKILGIKEKKELKNNTNNITSFNQNTQENNILENKNTQKIESSLTQNINPKPELKYIEKENIKQINQESIRQINIEELKNELNTIWDLLKIKDNTQAEHIIKSLSPDKWTTMEELRQNIKLEFNIEYKNEKSLYPYLKTLTDINLIKINNTGKKRTWKKNIIIIKEKIN